MSSRQPKQLRYDVAGYAPAEGKYFLRNHSFALERRLVKMTPFCVLVKDWSQTSISLLENVSNSSMSSVDKQYGAIKLKMRSRRI